MFRILLSASFLLASAAHAFCGFYVSSAGPVLSMQNNYRGPTDDFALVIPVPVILKKENVKTLPKEVFTRIDTLTDDLVFKAAEPIAGGIRAVLKTSAAKENRFQGRYIVKRPFNIDQCYRYGRAQGFTSAQTSLTGTQGKLRLGRARDQCSEGAGSVSDRDP